MKTEFLVAELWVECRLDRPYCFRLFSIRGGCSNVCITTQYCSVFACNALNCSAVACGARTSKVSDALKSDGRLFRDSQYSLQIQIALDGDIDALCGYSHGSGYHLASDLRACS